MSQLIEKNNINLKKIESYSEDYAKTLSIWKNNFFNAWGNISPLGFDDYFKRIEAINYTLEHDDGQGQLNLENADVIVVGVSRTSKTPTCIYLANQGIKAANYPLVPHVGISEELENVKNTQVVALITSAHTLVEIRRKRSIELGLNNTDNDYIDIHKVEEEITTAKRIFANKGWPVIDITRRSVEETASAIMNILSLKEEENVERK